ncbi:alpha-glycosidase [Alkalihalobacillus sp. LMS6]|uniref:glycoside hydrolase family 13 protein n=1 Tax=Alkalihalobacillus sp. LMS6 TaxID=2924034 RepID=UPI0020D143D8|nr:glycoside hydrolase family 13 protein [Alkalihalobacillus sp. LMS6]UTR07249.1 alpha-glycosidase [Alkalihalobacillus sp. LMS6]
MNQAGIIHTQQHHHLFLTSSHEAVIRLQTPLNEGIHVTVIHGDPYDWKNEQWQSSNSSMSLIHSDDMYDYWSVSVSMPYSRMRYGFKIETSDKTVFYAERGFYAQQPKEISAYFCLPYAHETDVFTPPSWVANTVWYQIFPERFANGEPARNPEDALPWGSEAPKPDTFFGGDLKGVIDHLDYLQDLGITGVYFTPIFKAFSNHKYDTIDYLSLDPHFGDEETMRTLVKECHKRGIRVMLDAVFNHSGYYFPPFQDLLKNGEDSAYKDWFHPFDLPLKPEGERPNYETFAFVSSMPKLNTKHPDVRAYLLKVAKYWIEEFNIDGWRLDVANEVDHDFWRAFRSEVKRVKGDVYILGEIWHQSSAWLQGDQFDAVMNYPLTDAIQSYALHKQTSEEAKMALTKHLMSYPDTVNAAQFNMLDSHDTARVLTTSHHNKALTKLQFTLLFSFPGSPCIYYGDEIGMAGENDPGCRACMIWDEEEQDLDMLNFLRKLVVLRKHHSAFGTYDSLEFIDSDDDDVLLYKTSTPEETLLFAYNRSLEQKTLSLPQKNEQGYDLFKNESVSSSFSLEQESFCVVQLTRGT